MERIRRHVSEHPVRLIVTTATLVLGSWVLAGAALVQVLTANHHANIAICRSLNEFRREVYVAAADLGVEHEIRDRFLPTENCETLP